MIIYKSTNMINGKVYIGKTKRSLKERKREHLRDMHKCSYYFYNALKKYGEENFTWEVIDTAETPEELNQKEKHWISHYKSYDDKYGYNSTLGGEVSWAETHIFTDEERERMSIAKSGKPFMVFDLKGNLVLKSNNTVKACEDLKISSNGSFGSILRGRGISINGYIPIYEENYTNELLQEKLNKLPKQIDGVIKVYKCNTDEFVGEFKTQKEIVEQFNIPYKRICDCLNGRQKSTNGYYFKLI